MRKLKLSPAQIVKSMLLLLVYGTLSVYFLFIRPHHVSSIEALKEVSLSPDSVFVMNHKNPKECFVYGYLDGVELRSIRMNKKECFSIIGMNEFFLPTRSKPQQYLFLIDDQVPTLIGKRHTIYQISADDEVLLAYERSATEIQEQMDLFYYLSLGFVTFIAFIIINTIYKKIKNQDL